MLKKYKTHLKFKTLKKGGEGGTPGENNTQLEGDLI
jgi:hypothetical protein